MARCLNLKRLILLPPLYMIEAVPSTPWPIEQMSILLRDLRLFSALLVGICFLQPLGNRHGTDLVPNLSNVVYLSHVPSIFQTDPFVFYVPVDKVKPCVWVEGRGDVPPHRGKHPRGPELR